MVYITTKIVSTAIIFFVFAPMRKGVDTVTSFLIGAVLRAAGGFAVVEGILEAGSIVVIRENTIQFHCMDVPIRNASQVPPHLDAQVRRFPVGRIGLVMFVAVLFGLVGAALFIWIPYTRVVVFDQPVSSVVHISSARLQKGGFIVVYFDGTKGSSVVGHTAYLSAGYYRDIDVPIASKVVIPPIKDVPIQYVQKNPSLFVRIFVDDGDMQFDELADTGAKDLFGKVYSKHFWMTYDIPSYVELLRSYAYFPVEFIADRLVP